MAIKSDGALSDLRRVTLFIMNDDGEYRQMVTYQGKIKYESAYGGDLLHIYLPNDVQGID